VPLPDSDVHLRLVGYLSGGFNIFMATIWHCVFNWRRKTYKLVNWTL